MPKQNSILGEVATNLGKDYDDIAPVIDEFLLQLHRRLFEYKGLNGDYIGEELWHEIGNQGYYHLLCFLDVFSERYQWEPGIANEYLLRLGQRHTWLPYGHQTEGWKPRSR